MIKEQILEKCLKCIILRTDSDHIWVMCQLNRQQDQPYHWLYRRGKKEMIWKNAVTILLSIAKSIILHRKYFKNLSLFLFFFVFERLCLCVSDVFNCGDLDLEWQWFLKEQFKLISLNLIVSFMWLAVISGIGLQSLFFPFF